MTPGEWRREGRGDAASTRAEARTASHQRHPPVHGTPSGRTTSHGLPKLHPASGADLHEPENVRVVGSQPHWSETMPWLEQSKFVTSPTPPSVEKMT